MLDLGGADPHRQCAERSVGGGVAVTADDRHPRLGQSQLRSDHMHDALLGITHRVQQYAELRTVASQRVDLNTRHRVGDRLVDIRRRHVVVLGGDREVGTVHRAPGQPQAVERLRAGDLVHEVQVDVDQVGLTRRTGADAGRHHMVRPHLLRQGSGLVGLNHWTHLTSGAAVHPT